MALLKQTKGRGEIRVRDNIDDLAVELAEYIADLSESSVKQRGVFAIAISGGSLINLMRKLSEAPYNKTVDWGKWYICWVDERLVGRNHAESNYKLAKENLFSKVPVIPSHMHCISDSSSAEDVVSGYEFVLRQLVKARTVAVSEVDDCPKFDLILLGMGADGHVASLFPNHAALEENNEWVTLITDSPKPPAERITFTLPVINSASNVAVVVTGGDKADALRLAIDDVGAENPVVPARMVHPTTGKLVWFLDSGACSKLEGFQFEEFNQGFA